MTINKLYAAVLRFFVE